MRMIGAFPFFIDRHRWALARCLAEAAEEREGFMSWRS
jgi:hypothetical protein